MLVTCPENPSRAPERLVVGGHALDHGALWHALGELVAPAGQCRLVVDAAGQRRRDRDDHVRGLDLEPVGLDRDGLAVVDDPPDGGLEDDPVAELAARR